MPEALSSYIARTALRLPPIAELSLAPDALSAIGAIVGESRIVAIGESFHHTHEQLVLRDHIVRHLVSQRGFNVILLEVITPGANPVDAYVAGGAGDARNALIEAGARMWRNEETASLVSWLRQHNKARPQHQVAVLGLDVLAIGRVMRASLEQLPPTSRQHIEALSYAFDVDGRSDQTAYNKLSEEDREALHRTFSGALTPHTETVLVICDALEMLKAGASGWAEGFVHRDRAMAGCASRFIDSAPENAKFIILSHNTHIAALAPTTPPTHPPMGARLRERYGADYFALGTTYGLAEFDPPIYGIAKHISGAGSADQHLAALNYVTAVLDLRGANSDEMLRLSGVGIGPLPFTEYPSLTAFDALAFVDRITNAHQLVETELSLDASAVDATRK